MVEQQVLAACAQLYGGATEGSKIREANAFLTEWQITDQAWEVANTILQNKTSVADTSKANVATAVFCTQTLRTKVQLDVNDLDSREKCEYMRSMLFQHMAKFRDAPAFSAALKQLCLALCGLAIHMDELWPDFIESLLNEFGGKVENFALLLDILKFLPEENKNKKLLVDAQKRKNNARRLEDNMSKVFGFIQGIESPTKAAKVKVLECFAAWMTFHGEPDVLFSGPNSFILPCFGYLADSDPALGNVAADVLCEVLVLFRQDELATEGSRQSRCVQPILDCCLSVQPQFEQLLSPPTPSSSSSGHQLLPNEATLRRFVRVFTEAGQALGAVIVLYPEKVEKLLVLHLNTIKAAHVPPNVKILSLGFWMCLGDEVARVLTGNREAPSPDATIAIQNVFKQVLGAVLEACAVPADGSMRNPFEDNDEDWDNFRADCRYLTIMMTEKYLLRFEEILSLLIQSLQTVISAGGGVGAAVGGTGADKRHLQQEAHLFLIAAVAFTFHVLPESEVHQKVVELLAWLPKLVTQTPNESENRYYLEFCQNGALSALEALAPTMFASKEILLGCLNCISSAILSPESKPKQQTAGYAFRRICRHDPSALTAHLPEILKVYEESLRVVAARIHMLVTEGVTEVIGSIRDVNLFGQGLEKMLLPLMTGLRSGHATPEQLGEIVDRLVIVMDNLNLKNSPPAFAEVLGNAFLNHLFNLVNPLCLQHATADNLIEKITRFQKHALRNMPDRFKTILPIYIETISACFEKKQLSSWLYASEYTVDQYCEDAGIKPALAQLFERLGQTAVRALRQMPQEPDAMNAELIEDFYGMYGRYAKCVPEIVYGSATYGPALELAPKCIMVPCRDSVDSILGFLEAVLRDRSSQASQHLLQQQGAQIVSACFRVALHNVTDKVRDSFPSFFNELQASCARYGTVPQYKQWVAQAMQTVLPWKKLGSEKEIQHWLHALQFESLGADGLAHERGSGPGVGNGRNSSGGGEFQSGADWNMHSDAYSACRKAWDQIWFRLGELQHRRKKANTA